MTSRPGGSVIWLIASRELRTRLMSKAFIWTTIVLMAVIIGGGFVVNLIQHDSSVNQISVGLTPQASTAAPLLTAIAKAGGLNVTTSETSEQAGTQAVRDGNLDALLIPTDNGYRVVVDQKVDTTLSAVLSSLAGQRVLSQEITKLGGDPATVNTAVTGATVDVERLATAPEVDSGQAVAGYLAGILIFISLMTSGQLITQGIVEEKTSRVVEVLLSTVRPRQLLTGKILGIGMTGLVQVIAVVGASVGSALGFGLLQGTNLNLGTAALWIIVWFLVGFTSYAVALAAAASLVSRQEDVASVTSPITFMMMIPYIIGVTLGPWQPDTPLMVWLSYLPFTSPLVMPIRVAVGAVGTGEALIALAVNIAVIPMLVMVASRIYGNAVLHSGGRMRLRTAFGSKHLAASSSKQS